MQAEVDDQLPRAIVTGHVARWRLLCGVLQGALLYALYFASKNTLWPATSPYLFAPLLMGAIFVPVLFVSALGHVPRGALWKWMLVALAASAVLGVYAMWRVDVSDPVARLHSHLDRIMPPGGLIAFFAVGLGITHALVMAGVQDGRRLASYSTYFEVAWKLGIQALFALLFVGVLWAILWMGSALFMLVKLDFLKNLINKSWFSIPVTALGLSTALHLTDVRPRIVRGIRSLLLVLMSWLLPITVLIVGGFLVSLPFTGLDPLWATRHATSVLLCATAILIVLVNATFQNGEVATEVARVLRIAARIACLLLAPMVAIGLYSLALRVGQYGWTADRVSAAACLLIAASYAGGYLWAALERGTWLTRVAQTNVVTALLIVATLIALYTPIADPARLGVASQVARLESGKMTAEQLDMRYLRFDGGRFGDRVLRKWAEGGEGSQAAQLQQRAKAALSSNNRYDLDSHLPADEKTRHANITVYPIGKTLPPDFLSQVWDSKRPYLVPDCVRQADARCDAYLFDMNGDGKDEVLIRPNANAAQLTMLASGTAGWYIVGTLPMNYQCRDLLDNLGKATLRTVEPEFSDLEINGKRLRLVPDTLSDTKDCQ